MLDLDAKKTLLRKIPHALYVCGVRNSSGTDLNGFTASWVMQASFEPPLLVNCVRSDSGSHALIQDSGVFALSFLEAGQKDIAAQFFKPQRLIADKFETVESYLGEATGCPIVKESRGSVDSKLDGTVDHGDATVFGGEVIGAGLHREGEILDLASTGWNYGG